MLWCCAVDHASLFWFAHFNLYVIYLIWQHVKKIVLSADEFLIVGYLNDVVAAHPRVTFGSYPFFSNPAYKTVSRRMQSLPRDCPPPPRSCENVTATN